MHVLTQFVDQFKLHLAVEENRIRSLRHLIHDLRNGSGMHDAAGPAAAAGNEDRDGDEDQVLSDRFHDPDPRDTIAAGDAGSHAVTTTPRNTGAVFTRVRRTQPHEAVMFHPSIDFLDGMGRYEEKRRELRSQREKEYSDFLAQDRTLGPSARLRSSSMQDLSSHAPKSPASTPLTSGAQVPRRTLLSEKRLQHEKYSEELRQQIEEKRLLTEQEKRRVQKEDDRLQIRVQKERAGLRLEYETEMAKTRLKSRSQPDLSQPVPATAHSSTRKQVCSPSYVFVNKKTPVSRCRDPRFEERMPQSTTISTQTGDSLMEEAPTTRSVGMIRTPQQPRPEPHPRVSKLLKTGSQMRLTPVKQKLRENQDKMLLRLASVKYNNKNNSNKS